MQAPVECAGAQLPAREEAIYEGTTRTVRCVDHEVNASDTVLVVEDGVADTPLVVGPGTAGASARREYDRRKAAREDRIRGRHPKLGGLILAVSGEPQSTTAWGTGAMGEQKLGAGLNRHASETPPPARPAPAQDHGEHRLPRHHARRRAYIIDAKNFRGRPTLKIDGGLFRPRVERLLVGSRDCAKLVDGILKQAHVVRGPHGVLPRRRALALLGGSFTSRDVRVLWPKKLYPRLDADGPTTSSRSTRSTALARARPAACGRVVVP